MGHLHAGIGESREMEIGRFVVCFFLDVGLGVEIYQLDLEIGLIGQSEAFLRRQQDSDGRIIRQFIGDIFIWICLI